MGISVVQFNKQLNMKLAKNTQKLLLNLFKLHRISLKNVWSASDLLIDNLRIVIFRSIMKTSKLPETLFNYSMSNILLNFPDLSVCKISVVTIKIQKE